MASSPLNGDLWEYGYVPMVVVGLIGYVGLCSLLRYRRVNALQEQFGLTDRKSLSQMTNEQARQICMKLADSEFPYFYNMALQVALMKVCFSIFVLHGTTGLLNFLDVLYRKYCRLVVESQWLAQRS